MVFFFSACSTLLSMVIMIPDFVVPTLVQLLQLVLIGLFALGGQVTLTLSYAMARASEVSIFNYSGILFSMLFSALFLSQPVKASSAFGAVLVILAGIVTLIGQKRAEARGAGGDNIAKLHKTIYKKL